jgi:hypothetical protein
LSAAALRIDSFLSPSLSKSKKSGFSPFLAGAFLSSFLSSSLSSDFLPLRRSLNFFCAAS